MTVFEQDTIAALASAAGRAGVAVVRVSGPDVADIADQLIGGLPTPRRAVMRAFKAVDGQAIDHGLALYFAAPASFTGEPVLELQGHGSPVLVDRLMTRLMELDARMAGPGEFSQRAFENDRMSLVQAEAVADVINASSAAAASAAMRSLEGVFARTINDLVARLTRLRAYTEGAIDFPDEDDLDFLEDGRITAELAALQTDLDNIITQATHGAALRDGLQVVILGRPNVGKSSLLNRLSRRDTAIVTDIAGTTRDVLDERLVIDGLPVTIIDTAGLRSDSDDPIEAEGVRRALAAVERADHVLYVVEASTGLTSRDLERLAALPNGLAITVVENKIDLDATASGYRHENGIDRVGISAATGDGMPALADHLRRVAGLSDNDMPTFIARRRHVDALGRAAGSIEAGRARFEQQGAAELLADELQSAQSQLGEITGIVTSDALLGEIFSTFCIGK